MGPQRSPAKTDPGHATLEPRCYRMGAWQAGSAHHSQMTSFRHSRNGSVAMRIRASGINTVHARLASGEIKTYYYHRATGMRLAGVPGSPDFLTSLAAVEP